MNAPYRFRISTALSFWLRAKSHHTLHSPFLFDFCRHILDAQRQYYAFDKLHEINDLYNCDDRLLSRDDRRAEAVAIHKRHRAASVTLCWSQILFRTVTFLNPAKSLELGTCLGFGSMAIALANPAGHVLTIDHDIKASSIAESTATSSGIKNISFMHGAFTTCLPNLAPNTSFDLVYIDGHHDGPATLTYVDMLKPLLAPRACVIVDDIRWDKGMYDAWRRLIQDSVFQATLDMHRMGFLFKNPSFKEKVDTMVHPGSIFQWCL